MRIGVDIMGSDTSPTTLFDGVVSAADALAGTLVVFATRKVIDTLPKDYPNIEFVIADSEVLVEDGSLRVFRRKRDSSLVLGITALKEGRIDAFVSAGSTGALITTSTVMLKKLPGIRRPALLTVLPSQRGSVAIVDVGGNVSVKVSHIVDFAHMGAAYIKCSRDVEVPAVGLLNIGVEAMKGNGPAREAYEVLEKHCARVGEAMTFKGNVEGREVFDGKVDVLVTDGFTGNVFLKTAEGVAAFMMERMQEALQAHRSEGMEKIFANLENHVNYDRYPGAIVCGVEGIVVKCHGYSSARAMCNGIKGAISLVQRGFLEKIKALLAEHTRPLLRFGKSSGKNYLFQR